MHQRRRRAYSSPFIFRFIHGRKSGNTVYSFYSCRCFLFLYFAPIKSTMFLYQRKLSLRYTYRNSWSLYKLLYFMRYVYVYILLWTISEDKNLLLFFFSFARETIRILLYDRGHDGGFKLQNLIVRIILSVYHYYLCTRLLYYIVISI